MSELFHALGINIKSLVIQGIDFAILLTVLTIFVYRPLARMMEARRKKIELGIKGGERAAVIIKEADETKAQKIREGETEAVAVIDRAEDEGQKRAGQIVEGAEKKAHYIVEEALATAAKKKQEELEHLMQEANGLIRQAIVKTVELDPEQVDEKLIQQALHEIHT